MNARNKSLLELENRKKKDGRVFKNSLVSEIEVGLSRESHNLPDRLSEVLQEADFYNDFLNLYRGGHSMLYHPEIGGKRYDDVAVKIINLSPDLSDRVQDEIAETNIEFLREIALCGDFFRLEGLAEDFSLENLTKEEQEFLFMAYEHALHEAVFGPYVLPTVFTSFPLKKPIVSHKPFREMSPVPERGFDWDKDFRETYSDLEKRGLLTDDRREIFFREGETAYAMVQDFVDFELLLKMERLDEGQLEQIRDFAQRARTAYEDYGMMLDPRLLDPRNKNIGFNKETGQLVLLDTNFVRFLEEGEEANNEYERIVLGYLDNIARTGIVRESPKHYQ